MGTGNPLNGGLGRSIKDSPWGAGTAEDTGVFLLLVAQIGGLNV